MNPLLLHIGSGGVFWSGLGLLAAAVLLEIRAKGGLRPRYALFMTAAGLFCLSLSSTPLPGWLLWSTVIFAAGMGIAFLCKYSKSWILQIATAACLITLAMLEFPHRRDPEPLAVEGRLWILADSISSGIGFDGEQVWSRLLEAEQPGRVLNRAVPGSKVNNSLPILQKRFDFLPGDALLIELGGNDLLSGVPAAEFRPKLDELLAAVAAAQVPAVMMELPLPPFRADYLRAQREAAKQYGVRLIPRHRFAAVLSGSESTVDGLHLSNFGHRKMAETVRRTFVFKQRTE